MKKVLRLLILFSFLIASIGYLLSQRGYYDGVKITQERVIILRDTYTQPINEELYEVIPPIMLSYKAVLIGSILLFGVSMGGLIILKEEMD
jgi:hypothetical protein